MRPVPQTANRMNRMTIAVTAATGQLGRLVVARLKAKRPAAEIVALARHPAKAADLGVAVREADYSKPETLAKALAGVDTLLLISSSEIGQRAAQHRNVIEAAKKAGVKRIVYTSLLRAELVAAEPRRGAQGDRGRAQGLGRSVHHPAQRLVHGELCRRDRRRARRRRLRRQRRRRPDLRRRARRLRRRGGRRADRRGPRGQDL